MNDSNGGADRQLTRSERQMARVRDQRAAGECGYSGCHTRSAKFYCAHHAEKVKAQKARRSAPDDESEAA